MAQKTAAYTEAFQTGEALPLQSEELGPFENALTTLLPASKRYRDQTIAEFSLNWAARINLADALRGRYFSGRLTDISVQKVEEPLDLLLSSGSKPPRLPYTKQVNADDLVGFMVNANLQSSRKRDMGQLIRPVWIVRNIYSATRNSRQLWTRYIGPNQAENQIDIQFRKSVKAANSSNGIRATTGMHKHRSRLGVDVGDGHQF